MTDGDRDTKTNYLEAILDGILQARITAAIEGPMGPKELRYAVDLARTDAVLSLRVHLLTGSKPSEVKAATQAFQILDEWIAAKGPNATGAATAAPVSKADAARVADMIARARAGG